jgi:hypothetical protein
MILPATTLTGRGSTQLKPQVIEKPFDKPSDCEVAAHAYLVIPFRCVGDRFDMVQRPVRVI